MQTVPASHLGIIERSQTAILATRNPDEAPRVTAMWFLWEEGRLQLSLKTSRQKAKNLLRDPRVSAFFTDQDNPYCTVELRGTVTIERDPSYRREDTVGANYGGANLRELNQPGETRIAVTVLSDRIPTFGA